MAKSEYLFPNTPLIEYLQQNSNGYRISTTNTIPANMWTPYNLSSPDGSDATLPLINYEYLSLLQGDKYQNYAKRSLVTTNTSSNLYQNLSVKYRLTQEFKSASNPKDEKLFFTVLKEKNTLIQEDKNVLPKVRFVKNIIFLKDKNEFKDNYKNIDFANSAVIYSNNQDLFSKEINNCTSTNSNIENINENNNSLSFQTENNCSELVFISNSFFPGWIAKIDNQKTSIFQTNHMFQSVLIPAGQHKIVLNYYPTNLNIAIVLALFSGTTLLVIFLYEKNKK